MTAPPPSTNQSLVYLLIFGVIFHIIYSWSIFDIYFRTPLVHGMTPVEPPAPAPAKRLVLFVADGLRADKMFEDRASRTPFLQNIILNHGSWGVSHTRVPTESRPGHVALIAGFYEDVSAVTRGWKTNPVNFDSLFNESRKTWSFGSPDILPMFSEGASDPTKVTDFMYPPEFEDFADEDASKLDTWVFDKFEEFLESSKKDSKLFKELQSDKIVFFFHLLGLDTNGHAHRPNSKDYLENINLVDQGIAKLVKRLEDFYGNDNATAFVLTADHGMSNRGNHGDGHPDNTMTPLVAWGAGVSGPKKRKAPKKDSTTQDGVSALSAEWGLSDLVRRDVLQADIAPLMSVLIGIPYPMNSVGELPVSYLDLSEHHKALAALGNARQILLQYFVKEESKRRTEIFFNPFPGLLDPLTWVKHIQFKIAQADSILEEGALSDAKLVYSHAVNSSMALAELAVAGLRYYQTYDWLFLRSIISAGYAGWIIYSLLFVVKTYGFVGVVVDSPTDSVNNAPQTRSKAKVHFEQQATAAVEKALTDQTVNRVALGVFALFGALLFYKNATPNYYMYVVFLVYLWTQVVKDRKYLLVLLPAKWLDPSFLWNLAKGLLYIAGLEVLVYSYFMREVLTPCLIVAGLIWPETTPTYFQKKNWAVILMWRFFCVILSIFLLLPVEYAEDIRLVNAGGALIIASALVALYMLPKHGRTLPSTQKASIESLKAPRIIVVQIIILVLSMIVVNDTSGRLKRKEGLPFINQTISWAILASCILVPMIDIVREGHHFLRRLVVIYLSFAPLFILLSVSYETLFYFCFAQTVLVWLLMERLLYSEVRRQSLVAESKIVVSKQKKDDISRFRPLETNDLWTAIVFLFFINVAFFGTGNIASVASFSLESVYRFTTVFNPFLFGALLILKLWVPFFLLSAVFGVISRTLELPAFSLLLLVLSTTDVMTLNFFFLVRDYGSWMEIGTTISHYIIASAFIVFQIILFSIGHLLVGRVLIPEAVKKKIN